MQSEKNLKIFVVDDDLFCLNMYQHYLETLGYNNVHVFQNGTDCLNQLTQDPAIIFLDHNMDTLNGFEVLKKIKRFNPNTNVVMVSGQEDLEPALNALKYGAFDYIIKGEQVKEKMKYVIERIASLMEASNQRKPSLLKRIASRF